MRICLKSLGEYRWAFDNACSNVGIEGLTPHGLRHTTASSAISAGANVKVVQRLLGHATAAMTLDRCGHLLNDDLTGVADVLGQAIDRTAISLRYSGQLSGRKTAQNML
ncbi:MAG: tyrosine-type recombinase/integrase [Actinomycetia bacterium]|nr:tyrosine-type recombinase/integrase [Actinomycetes bacterium]